jgi:hypothetical protein
MAVLTKIDATTNFNANGFVNLDIGGWDYCVVHLVSPTGSISFNTSNDGGESTGAIDESPRTALNFQPVQFTNTANGAGVTSSSGNGVYKLNVAGKYLQLIGSAVTATKILVTLQKIC